MKSLYSKYNGNNADQIPPNFFHVYHEIYDHSKIAPFGHCHNYSLLENAFSLKPSCNEMILLIVKECECQMMMNMNITGIAFRQYTGNIWLTFFANVTFVSFAIRLFIIYFGHDMPGKSYNNQVVGCSYRRSTSYAISLSDKRLSKSRWITTTQTTISRYNFD